MPFTAPAQRIVLAQRVGGELFRHEDAPQIGVSVESDSVHIKDFALHPVSAGPDRDRRRDPRIGVVNPALHDQAFGCTEVFENIMDLKARPGPAGVAEIIGRAQLGEKIESAGVFEDVQKLDQPGCRHEEPQVILKL
jgi:hypothetical protein